MRYARIAVFGLLIFLLTSLNGLTGGGDELSVKARLIWGTDGPKPNDPTLKEIDSELKEKLSAIFKWKSYYECGTATVQVPPDGTKRVRVSPKCEVEVTNLGKARAEVKLFGKGVLTVSKKQTLTKEPLILAGPDKNESAWFVVITNLK